LTRTVSTTTQAGGEKRIEYCQLKVATLAEEGQQVFMAAILAFHVVKTVAVSLFHINKCHAGGSTAPLSPIT
jgi:hypothetical protein